MADITTCVNLCETTSLAAGPNELESLLAGACAEGGFAQCARVYAGSYFCENYFCALGERFHDSLRAVCLAHGLRATLVVPLFGQAFLDRGMRHADEILDRYGDIYDEVVANDIAAFLDLAGRGMRVGCGRLFDKTRRDARYADVFARAARPSLSPEARACIAAQPRMRPLIDVDPISAVVDVSDLLEDAPTAEIAMHLPDCYATTGRNCSAASADAPDSEKFRIGGKCAHHCLRIDQGSRVEAGVRYLKHGKTYFYPNPLCQIAGCGSWRIVYAAGRAQPEGDSAWLPWYR